MSENEIGLSGVSGSGSNISGPDTYTPPELTSKDKQNLNRSPVLYLRRRRNMEVPGEPAGDSAGYRAREHGKLLWYRDPDFKLCPNEPEVDYKVDPGYIYPNHYSVGRAGQIEWIKFRDYKRANIKWIQETELVID